MGYRPTGKPNGRPPQPLSDRVKAAIEAEALQAIVGETPTPGELAAASGLTRRAIRKWRAKDRYQAALVLKTQQLIIERQKLMAEQLLQRLEEGDRQREAKKVYCPWRADYEKARWLEMTEKQREVHVHRWIVEWARRYWHQLDLLTGPLVHELDPRNYADPEAYAEALIARGFVPIEEPSWSLVPIGSR